jgi:hypothetical protein
MTKISHSSAKLKSERQQLVSAAQLVRSRFRAGEIDIDDAIEELRPIRLRIFEIDCLLKGMNNRPSKY